MPARIEDVWWDGDVLRLKGYAYIAFQELADREVRPDPADPRGVRPPGQRHPAGGAPRPPTRRHRGGAGRRDQLRRVRLGGRGPGERAAAPREVPDRQLAAAARGPGEGRHPPPVALRHRPGPGQAAGLADRRRRADRAHHAGRQLRRRDLDHPRRGRGHPGRRHRARAHRHPARPPVRPGRRASLRARRDDGTSSLELPVATGGSPSGGGTPFVARRRPAAPSAATRTSTRPSRTAATWRDGDVWSLSLLPEADRRPDLALGRRRDAAAATDPRATPRSLVAHHPDGAPAGHRPAPAPGGRGRVRGRTTARSSSPAGTPSQLAPRPSWCSAPPNGRSRSPYR